ncbi:MAG: PKD domain-containing protein, partial [Planctomycetota bacterium]
MRREIFITVVLISSLAFTSLCFANYVYILDWEADNGNLRKLEVGTDGDIYVCGDRVKKFDPMGNYVETYFIPGEDIDFDSNGNAYTVLSGAGDVNHVNKYDNNFNLIGGWAYGQGSGNGQLRAAESIAVDKMNNFVYVADTYNHRIQKFDLDGNFIIKWGSQGSNDGQFLRPRGIAVGANGNVVVADTSNKRVQVFSEQGAFLFKIYDTDWGTGYLDDPRCVAVDLNNNIYAGDSQGDSFFMYSSSGTFIDSMPRVFSDMPEGLAVDNGYVYYSKATKVSKFGIYGIQPPIANAGNDQTVGEGQEVTLDGTSSYDPEDGSVSSYMWNKISGPEVDLSDIHDSRPTFIASSVTSDTDIVFSLIVGDSDGYTSSPDYTIVTVLNVDPPVADAGEDITAETGENVI